MPDSGNITHHIDSSDENCQFMLLYERSTIETMAIMDVNSKHANLNLK